MNGRTTVVFQLCWAMIAAVPMSYSFAQGGSRTNGQENDADDKLFESASANATQAFLCLTKSNENLAKLLLASPTKVSSAFLASKVAWVEGRPTYAISALESAVRNHGESIDPQFGLPITVLGKFWIGTISRHFGDMRNAEKTYAEILKLIESDGNLKPLAVFCYLYQAEMAYQTFGSRNAAVDWLKKIKGISPPPNRDSEYFVYQEWADYQMSLLTKGVQEARLSLRGSSRKREQCILMIMSQLGVNGITGEPRVGFYNDDRRVFLAKALDLTVECRTSPIDRSLAQFLLARISEEKRDVLETEKHYADVFVSDSYFAPECGINLACFQKRQGQVVESQKNFQKVKEQFPGYSELVDDLSAK